MRRLCHRRTRQSQGPRTPAAWASHDDSAPNPCHSSARRPAHCHGSFSTHRRVSCAISFRSRAAGDIVRWPLNASRDNAAACSWSNARFASLKIELAHEDLLTMQRELGLGMPRSSASWWYFAEHRSSAIRSVNSTYRPRPTSPPCFHSPPLSDAMTLRPDDIVIPGGPAPRPDPLASVFSTPGRPKDRLINGHA